MKKLMSVIVAAMFAASTAFVATPAGAQAKDEKKKADVSKMTDAQKAEAKKKAQAKAAKMTDAEKAEAKKKAEAMKK